MLILPANPIALWRRCRADSRAPSGTRSSVARFDSLHPAATWSEDELERAEAPGCSERSGITSDMRSRCAISSAGTQLTRGEFQSQRPTAAVCRDIDTTRAE